MFGYLASKSISDSPFWEYASVAIFREVGSNVQLIKAKIFDKTVINNLQNVEVNQQIEFEVSYVNRKTRKYTNVVMLRPTAFENCDNCGRATQECEGVCAGPESERLDGVFKILKLDRMDYGLKFILGQGGLLVNYLPWISHPFYETSGQLQVNDDVEVVGWRSEDRITNLRKFQKCMTSSTWPL